MKKRLCQEKIAPSKIPAMYLIEVAQALFGRIFMDVARFFKFLSADEMCSTSQYKYNNKYHERFQECLQLKFQKTLHLYHKEASSTIFFDFFVVAAQAIEDVTHQNIFVDHQFNILKKYRGDAALVRDNLCNKDEDEEYEDEEYEDEEYEDEDEGLENVAIVRNDILVCVSYDKISILVILQWIYTSTSLAIQQRPLVHLKHKYVILLIRDNIEKL